VYDKGTIVLYLHFINKDYSVIPCIFCSAVIDTVHFGTVRQKEYTVMSGSGYHSALIRILLKYGIVICLGKRAQGRRAGSIPHGIVGTPEIVGGIHHIVGAVMLKGKRTFRPPSVYLLKGYRPAFPFGIFIVHTFWGV